VISELFPSLFLLRAAKPAAKDRFTYLLRRREGNILLATKDDALAHAADLLALQAARGEPPSAGPGRGISDVRHQAVGGRPGGDAARA
jgi:hypothetical protein